MAYSRLHINYLVVVVFNGHDPQSKICELVVGESIVNKESS